MTTHNSLAAIGRASYSGMRIAGIACVFLAGWSCALLAPGLDMSELFIAAKAVFCLGVGFAVPGLFAVLIIGKEDVMGFKLVGRGRGDSDSGLPRITLCRDGRITVNCATQKQFGLRGSKWAQVFFDVETRCVALKFFVDRPDEAPRSLGSSNNPTWQIHARRLWGYLGISRESLPTYRSFTPEVVPGEERMIAFDVSDILPKKGE